MNHPARSQARSAARLAAVQALYQQHMEGTALARLLDEFHPHRLGRTIDDEDFDEAEYADAEVPFFDDDGLIGYVDMFFDSLGVIGEADGLIKYSTGEDLIAEKRREDRLRRLHPVVRWDWQRIWSDPKSVAGQIRDASTWRRAG